MKKLTLICSILICSSSLVTISAQTVGRLWGMVPTMGDSGGGVMFKYDPISSYDSIAHPFPITGKNPVNTKLLQATDGNFYGMTRNGGAYNGGTIFMLTTSGKITTLHNFSGTADGANPYGSLIQATDGNLYGMTSSGGAAGYGTIFKITTSGAFTLLYSFAGGTDGRTPDGSLVQATDGNLYGMTQYGGGSNDGVIFKCTTSGTETVIATFTGTNGQYPNGSLIQATDGNFYGMTYEGGTGAGNIFKCTTAGVLSDLVDFNGTDGQYPYGSLMQATDGNLYGMTEEGGSSGLGTIFKCTTTGTLTTIVNFSGTANGSYPQGDVMQATDGNLYGLTAGGGLSGDGVLFKCTTSGTISTISSFTGALNGYSPYGSVIQATDGNLYGMTEYGGLTNGGLIFRSKLTGPVKIIYNFGITSIGYNPDGSLIQGIDGNMYGMTSHGGSMDLGTIFEYNSVTGAVTTLVNFNGANGQYPYGSLIQAMDGNLYGMTYQGGTNDSGTIFKCTTTGVFTTLFNFTKKQGYYPHGDLLQASDGILYGMTYGGGTSDLGVYFKCTTSGTYTVLHNFAGGASDGAVPYGSLIQASDNFLYGMTSQGGTSNAGTIISCTTSGTVANVFSFGGTNGGSPEGSLIQATDGNLYGMTYVGGTGAKGNIFKCTTSGTFTPIVNFTGTNGSNPYSSLIQASDGNLYGMTFQGGTGSDGTVFKCTTSGTLTTLVNLTGTINGSTPQFGNLLEAVSASISSSISCSGSTLTTSVRGDTGPYTYLWSTGATTSSISNVTSAGTYSVTVSGTKGITVSASYNDTYNIVAVTTGSPATICAGSSTGLSASGSGGTGTITYNWMPGSLSGANPSVSPSLTTIYTVTAIDGSSCTATATQTVTVNSLPVVGITGTSTICSGSNTTLTANGANTYVWTGGPSTAGYTVSPTITTTYTVTGTNTTTGCSNTGNQVVTVNSLPTVAISGDSSVCKSADLLTAVPSGNAPFTYTWNTAGTNDTVMVRSVKNFANTYSVTVSDVNGCTANNSFVVYRDSFPSISICEVSVDTGSTHNVIVWDKTGVTRIDSFKLYYMNSANKWQLIKEVPFSAPNYLVDSTPVNNPNANTVRYCLTVVDSCGKEEHFGSSPWQNTSHIINSGGGTFSWSGTGYLKENVVQPVSTYYLMRDSISNGNWKVIDSTSGTQNTMTDVNFALYPKARWRVDALLDTTVFLGCSVPELRPVKSKTYNSSHSNTATSVITGIQSSILNSNSISVYPNPANQVLNVRFNNIKAGTADMQIMDITGRMITETQSEVNPGSITHLNIEGLSSGVYFVKVTSNGSSQVVKFIKE